MEGYGVWLNVDDDGGRVVVIERVSEEIMIF